MSSLPISHDGDCLNVNHLPIEKLRSVAETGGVIYWEREGMVGKVPNGVIRDAIQAWDDWRRLRDRGRVVTIPPQVGEIRWGQAVTPQVEEGC